MGLQNVRTGLAQRKQPALNLDEAVSRLGSVKQVFRTGLFTNLSNPKIVLYLAAMIAPLLPPDPSSTSLRVVSSPWPVWA